MQNLNKEFETIDRAKMEDNSNKLQNIETILPKFNNPVKQTTNIQLLDNIELPNNKLRNLRDK